MKKVVVSFFSFVIAFILSAGMLVSAAPLAAASATGCAGTIGDGDPHGCVHVVGSGTWLKEMQGGISIQQALPWQLHGKCYQGHWTYSSSHGNIKHTTGHYKFCNTSLIHHKTFWTQEYPIKKHFRPNTRVCATFHPDGGKAFAPACETIDPVGARNLPK